MDNIEDEEEKKYQEIKDAITTFITYQRLTGGAYQWTFIFGEIHLMCLN